SSAKHCSSGCRNVLSSSGYRFVCPHRMVRRSRGVLLSMAYASSISVGSATWGRRIEEAVSQSSISWSSDCRSRCYGHSKASMLCKIFVIFMQHMGCRLAAETFGCRSKRLPAVVHAAVLWYNRVRQGRRHSWRNVSMSDLPVVGPTSHYFYSQRLKLHYVDWGNADKPLMVLVHGGRDHARNWDQVAVHFRSEYHIIAPDLRGHGDSEWARGSEYSMIEYVLDLAQFLEQVAAFPVLLI